MPRYTTSSYKNIIGRQQWKPNLSQLIVKSIHQEIIHKRRLPLHTRAQSKIWRKSLKVKNHKKLQTLIKYRDIRPH